MNEIFKSINLRLSNPFILSFIFSWIFWNWPILIGLIWYNSETILKLGYTDYKDLIIQNADWKKNYLYPACFAVLFPYLKLGFNAMQTLVNSIDERNVKKISGKGYVPTVKYLDLRDQYENDIKRLSDIIEKESTVINQNLKLQTSVTEKDSIINNLKGEQEVEKKKVTETKKDLAEERKKNKLLEADVVLFRQRVDEAGLDIESGVRILYATYGVDDKFDVITEVLRDKLRESLLLEVENKTLGGDPAPNFIKHLFVLYSVGTGIKTLKAIEGSGIKLDNNEIVLDLTKAGKKIKYLENESKIGDVFKGEWELVFTKDGVSSSERVIIDDRGIYYANGIAVFILKAIDMNSSKSNVKFDKVRLDGTFHSKEQLIFSVPDKAMGNNNLGYSLKYYTKKN